jgi:hypothetical protein
VASKQRKSVELPKGFKPIKSMAQTWDHETESPLEGSITEFRSIDSKYGKDKKQRNAIVQRDSDKRLITVWESAGTRSLFDLKVGTHVWINFDGLRRIKGRSQPMKAFTIAVKS